MPLLSAAQSWADGDAYALAPALAPGGKLTYEDHRDQRIASYSPTEIPAFLAVRTSRVERLELGRVQPPYFTVPGGESLHAFVIRAGLDYPILFTGLTSCAHGVVFRELSISVSSR